MPLTNGRPASAADPLQSFAPPQSASTVRRLPSITNEDCFATKSRRPVRAEPALGRYLYFSVAAGDR